MATTYFDYQKEAHGKRIWAKAELGVAEILTKSRKEKGMNTEVLGKIEDKGGTVTHIASRFYTTDQMATYYWYAPQPYFNHPQIKAEMATDNMARDIDLWCSSMFYLEEQLGPEASNKVIKQNRLSGRKHSISVKSQTRALTSYNISLELETFSDDGRTRLGWYEAGQADFYAFVIGHKFVIVSKDKLKYMTDTGCFRTVSRLTAAAKATNVGRTYNDARNLLVPVKSVVEIGTVMEMPEWYIKAFKSHNKVQAYKDSVEFWKELGHE